MPADGPSELKPRISSVRIAMLVLISARSGPPSLSLFYRYEREPTQASTTPLFDGWRAQLVKDSEAGHVYSRNGNDHSMRFADIRVALLSLPAQSVVIVAEVVVCDTDGKPDFNALMAGSRERLCAWSFDLMALNERDLRPLPLAAPRPPHRGGRRRAPLCRRVRRPGEASSCSRAHGHRGYSLEEGQSALQAGPQSRMGQGEDCEIGQPETPRDV